ncbi:MAG TPA: transcriptional regulator, partial [Brevundimonas sp.]
RRNGLATDALDVGIDETGALAGLGLSPGYIGSSVGDDVVKTFGLGLPSNLTIADAVSIKTAGEKLQAAMKAVRDAYRALDPATTAPAANGPVPAYLTNQLANYQAALARLGG